MRHRARGEAECTRLLADTPTGSAASRPPPAPRVLVVAVRFPSPIQPWLLNQIVQVYRHGGSARIVARRAEGKGYPEIVDDLGLRENTLYLNVVPWTELIRGLLRPLATGPAGRAARQGLRTLLRSPYRPRGFKESIKAVALAPVVAIEDVDVVHAHSLTYAYDYMHVSRILGVPMVLTFHGHTTAGVATLAAPRRSILFEHIDAALVNTTFARTQLESLGCPSSKIRILPQGVRLSDYPFRPLPFPDSGPVRLLSVSRLQPDKGLRYAIDGVDLLLKRGYDVEYTVVGGGPEEEGLRTHIETLGRADRIRLAGRVSDEKLRDLYGRAHVFILPSLSNESDDHTETQGVVIQEAQASGLIITASRVGGIPECVDEGRSAFLFPDRDPVAIAEVVAGVLDKPELWSEWQEAGRRWVEDRFDIDRLGTILIELYATIRAIRGNGAE